MTEVSIGAIIIVTMADAHNQQDDLWRSRLRSNRDHHVYRVFHDPEFQEEVERLRSIDQDGTVNETDRNSAAETLASRYAITLDQLNVFMLPANFRTAVLSRRAVLKPYSRETGTFSIEFPVDVSPEELHEIVEEYAEIRRDLFHLASIRRKPGNDPDLVYAIFKARQKGSNYRQIFSLYEAGQLPGYEGRKPSYRDQEALERYYFRNRPLS